MAESLTRSSICPQPHGVAPVPKLTSFHLCQAPRRSRAERNAAASMLPIFLWGERGAQCCSPDRPGPSQGCPSHSLAPA